MTARPLRARLLLAPASLLGLLALPQGPGGPALVAPARAQEEPAPAGEVDRSPARPLTLSEALELGKKNNRDLLAARERLRGSHADVERALSALLPRLSAQGRLTVNEPEVSLSLDQRGQAFNGLLQGAVLGDLSRSVMQRPGNLTASLFGYCQSGAVGGGAQVQAACQQVLQQAQMPGADVTQGLTSEQISGLLSSANVEAKIVPRLQVDATIALSMPLIAPPAYAALSGARKGYRAQQKALEVTEAQLLQSIASAFYAAAGSDELVLARRHAIEVSQQTLQNARARLEAGVVNRVEVTRAELALIQAQQRLLEAEDQRGAAYRVLATLILQREPFKVVPPRDPEVEGRSDGELVAEALSRRPELQQLSLSVQAAEAQALSQGLRWLPTLGLFGNIRLTNATGFAGRVDSYAAGLQLDWLLFDGLERDAARHAAAAQAREARLRLRQLKDNIADEVQNARRQALTRREGLKTAQRSVQLARETLDLVRIQHDAGTATQLDLLTAQDQLVLAEVAVAQARFDLSLSDIGLRRLLGRALE